MCKTCNDKGWGLFINPPGDWTYSGPCWDCSLKHKGVSQRPSGPSPKRCNGGSSPPTLANLRS